MRFNFMKLVFAVVIFVIISCNKKGASENIEIVETSTDEISTFVPNPQIIPKQEVKTLEIGQKAPEFNLPGIDGKFHKLSEYDTDILIILFTCNHCPTAQAYEERVIKFVDDYKDKNVRLVGISPNSPIGVLLEELGYSDLNDGYYDMVLRAEYKGYNFPYLYDGDNQAVSVKYGPVATPQAFVFDKNRILRYVGRLDAVEKPGTTNAEDLRAAVDAILAGKAIENPTTKTFGCSTKWGWKTEMREKVNKEWAEKPVIVTKIDEKGIVELVQNRDSDKLRLVNIWATWCGPCKVEYPEFIDIHRMFKDRGFEFISLSADKPDNEKNVKTFLESRNSAITNYLFDSEDKYALIEMVDPKWNGALPYTMLIEPNGKVVWKHQGEIDFLELRRAIVDNEMIGRYF